MMLATAACLIYTSCKKESRVTPGASTLSTTNNATSSHSGPQARNSSKAVTHWEDAVKDCIKPALNCGAVVVISAPRYDALVSSIDNNGTPQGTALFFSSPNGIATSIELGIDQSDLANLQSGQYNVIYHVSGTTPGVVYFFFGLAPLTRLNAEYIIPTTH